VWLKKGGGKASGQRNSRGTKRQISTKREEERGAGKILEDEENKRGAQILSVQGDTQEKNEDYSGGGATASR